MQGRKGQDLSGRSLGLSTEVAFFDSLQSWRMCSFAKGLMVAWEQEGSERRLSLKVEEVK